MNSDLSEYILLQVYLQVKDQSVSKTKGVWPCKKIFLPWPNPPSVLFVVTPMINNAFDRPALNHILMSSK